MSDELYLDIENLGDYEMPSNKLPAGTYLFEVQKAQRVTSKVKGSPGFEIDALVIDGDLTGRHLFYTFWLPWQRPDKTAEENKKSNGPLGARFREFIEACQIDYTNTGLSIPDLLGRQFIGVVKLESDAQYGEKNELARCRKVS